MTEKQKQDNTTHVAAIWEMKYSLITQRVTLRKFCGEKEGSGMLVKIDETSKEASIYPHQNSQTKHER
jgi:hypothetical protein